MGRLGRLGSLGKLGRTLSDNYPYYPNYSYYPYSPKINNYSLLTPHYSLSIKGLSLECYALAIGRYEYHTALGACYVADDINKA